MSFGNPVVGGQGGELIRESIKSPNYVANVQGWAVFRDGTADFNNVTVRGDLIVGTPPSPPNPYIHATVLAGIPTIAVYDGVHTLPARIQGFNLGNEGGMVFDAGDTSVESTAIALGGDFAEFLYENVVGNHEFGLISVGNPYSSLIKLRATSDTTNDLEFGFDLTAGTPDSGGGRMYTFGELLSNSGNPDDNYDVRVIDGKVDDGSQTATTIGTTDTSVATANAQNVYVEQGWYYIALVSVDFRNNNANGRISWKLWDGALGGTQLGGTQRKYSRVQSTSGFDNEFLIFVWRQATTKTIADLNLSAVKELVTAGAATAQVNAAFSISIFKSGDADKIQNL
jgi:hypothetical protein